jgi:integrase/recombinase XerD
MTTPTLNSVIPSRNAEIFKRANYTLEIETAILIEKFKTQQQIDGVRKETVDCRIQQLKQIAQLIDINDSNQVKTWLANLIETKPCNWANTTKTKFIDTYTTFLTFQDKTWKAPKYKKIDKLPFIPTEQEIDLLIAHCGKTTSTVLQFLKETGVRIGELVQLKWLDIDFERKVVSITPEKNSNGRILPISEKLIAMLNKLPRLHKDNVFQPKKHMLREYYTLQRKAIAERLQNPRLLKITFHTFRHWKGTMEYHKTLDIMHVKKVLGHKTTRCTEIYINLESALFLNSTTEWISKISHSLEEEQKFIDAGYTLVRSINEKTAIYKIRP